MSGADVSITGPTSASLTTGVGSLTQTDWSGGSGQATSTDLTMFETSSNVSVNNPVGDITLLDNGGTYSLSGTLTSSAFDVGATSTFQEIIFNPTIQPPAVGPDSVKFQVASNADGGIWNFVGPDGTGNSYYTVSNFDLASLHGDRRYVKYKAFLSTNDPNFTPNLSDTSLTFTGGCIPPGQVAFDSLPIGSYQVTVSKAGYTTYIDNISVQNPWQSTVISLVAN